MQCLLLFVVILYVTDVNTQLLQLKNFKVGECTYQGERKQSPEPSPCSSSKTTKLRNASPNAALWDDGRVPYILKGSFTDRQKSILEKVMGLYKYYTCIKFVPKTRNDKSYAKIINEVNTCCSEIGKVPGGGFTVVDLGPRCFEEEEAGTVIHELMHLIGFYHEHNRSDRNDYIELTLANVNPNYTSEFDIESGNTFNIPYDYDSTMHYGPFHGARSYSHKIFVPKDKSVSESRLGQICGFSKRDITKINILYNCPQKTAELNLKDDLLYGVDISTAEQVKYEKNVNQCTTC
ncbi:zinc metalloproteinase nas-1-like [Diabrotica virgifera virgifera]|uniref:Metalloendopeptidase n=1 Tax=Diabrotica virgifera virgifera TaxID=50390 RepID=A0ABM5JZ50_DIAVI|nr:zinc metalloproteinase nas-1-like [Diabrotica virgifera virgifera]